MPAFKDTKFIGWDSEGINTGKIDEWTIEQKLTLIANSEGDYLYDEGGISFESRLNFISECARKYPNATHVFFGGSYDFNKILEGLPRDVVEKLHTSKFFVKYGPFAFRYRPRKELVIARIRKGVQFTRSKPIRPQCDAYIRFWDVIGFFQSSFLEVVKKWLGEDYPYYKLIMAGKAARDTFKGSEKDFIIEYNRAELRALVAVMKLLHAQFVKLDLPVQRWDGAGAVAAQVFKRYGLVESYFHNVNGKKEKIQLRQEIQEASIYAYFGGRIESAFIGEYEGTVYNYDINSAYPYAASQLPNMNDGKWIHYQSRMTESQVMNCSPMTLFRVQYYFHRERIYYPFPQRCLGGSVIFPRVGERWFYAPEVWAAMRSLKKGDQLFVWEAWEFRPKKEFDITPFSVVRSLYLDRQRLIQANDPAEKVLKLGLNSIYGKLCQKLGWNEAEKTSPRFHFLLFAGFITSYIRGMIYDVVRQAESDVISINTDGIISKAPLNIRHSDKKELGGWSLEISDAIVQLQSGVYWIRKGNEWKERARGLGRIVGEGDTEAERKANRNEKIELRLNRIRNAWREKKQKIYFENKLFVTSKKACISDDWFKRWGHWFIMHDEKTGEKGRSLELQCSGWGKRRLTKRVIPGKLTLTEAAENIEWNGVIGTDDITKRDLGEPYDLPWLSGNAIEEYDDDEIVGV